MVIGWLLVSTVYLLMPDLETHIYLKWFFFSNSRLSFVAMPAYKTTVGFRSLDEVRADSSAMILSKVLLSVMLPSNTCEYFKKPSVLITTASTTSRASLRFSLLLPNLAILLLRIEPS